jgi:hypothetical protein
VTSNTETDSSASINPVVVLSVVVIVAVLLALATVVLRKKEPENSSFKQLVGGFEPSTRWKCHPQGPFS